MTVKIVLVYQSLLGIYGDQGNSKVLARRLQWRGIDADVVMVEPGETLPRDGSIYLLGGGEDNAQTTAVRELRRGGDSLTAVLQKRSSLTLPKSREPKQLKQKKQKKRIKHFTNM